MLNYTKQHGAGAGSPEERRVQPLHLTFHEFAWYLLSWDLKAQDYRCYMLTRINRLRETDTRFTRPRDFAPRQISANGVSKTFPMTNCSPMSLLR